MVCSDLDLLNSQGTLSNIILSKLLIWQPALPTPENEKSPDCPLKIPRNFFAFKTTAFYQILTFLSNFEWKKQDVEPNFFTIGSSSTPFQKSAPAPALIVNNSRRILISKRNGDLKFQKLATLVVL